MLDRLAVTDACISNRLAIYSVPIFSLLMATTAGLLRAEDGCLSRMDLQLFSANRPTVFSTNLWIHMCHRYPTVQY